MDLLTADGDYPPRIIATPEERVNPTMRIPVLLLSAASILVGCGSSSIENYVETSTRIGCRYVKKCEKDDWKFDSVRDCVDETLDAPAGVDGKTRRDVLIESCDDFDSSAARKCLAGSRKAKRQCDLDAPSDDQKKACAEVCGNPAASELFTDPSNHDLALTLLEEIEADESLD